MYILVYIENKRKHIYLYINLFQRVCVCVFSLSAVSDSLKLHGASAIKQVLLIFVIVNIINLQYTLFSLFLNYIPALLLFLERFPKQNLLIILQFATSLFRLVINLCNFFFFNFGKQVSKTIMLLLSLKSLDCLKKLNLPLYVCCVLCSVAQSCLTLAVPWTVAHQASLAMGFSRQKYGSGLPLLSI